MILFFTDPHINETAQFSTPTETGFTIRQQEALQCCQDIVDVLQNPKYHFSAVVCGGDVFNPVGNQISVSNLATAEKFITTIQKECIKQGIVFYILVGNHDLSANMVGFHKLISFKNYQNVRIVESLETVGNLVFLPYMYDDEAVNTYLEAAQDKQNKIAFSHLEIKNVEIGAGIKTSKGASIDLLKRFKMVFQGHYHTPSRPADNIIVAGSTQKTSFKDPGGGTMVIYDEDTNNFSRVPYSAPSWYTFTDENLEDVKTLDFNNYVKLIISSKNMLNLTGITMEYLKNFKGSEIVIDVKKISGKRLQTQETDIKKETEEEVLQHFIESANVPEEEKQTLIEVGLDLITRARK